MRDAVALERGAGNDVGALGPTVADQVDQPRARAPLGLDHQRIVIRPSVGARQRDGGVLRPGTALIGVGAGGGRTVNRAVEFGCLQQVASGRSLVRGANQGGPRTSAPP